MSSIQSVSVNTYSNTPVLDPNVPPAVDSPKSNASLGAPTTAAKPTPQQVSQALHDLVKNTYPRLERRESMSAEGQVYNQKRIEAMFLKGVFSNLIPLQADPDAARAQLLAMVQKAQGKGPDAVLEAMVAAKDELMTPKIKDAIRNSPTTLGGAKEDWSDAQRDLYHATRSVASYERYHLRGLATKALSNISDPAVRAEGWQVTKAMERMVMFNPHDLDRLADAKEILNEGIKDDAKDAVAMLRAAADELHGPALDDLIRQAPSILSRNPPEEWSKEDRRLAWLMRSIQRADFDWASSLNNFVIPDTPRRSPA